MKKLSQILVVAALSLFSVSTAIGMDNEIKVEEKAEFGKYLADSRGMTLYWHVKDVPGKSMCKDLPCTEKWPPYYQKAIVAL